MDNFTQFQNQCAREIESQGQCDEAISLSHQWMGLPSLIHYSYHFTWLGRPIIQYPQDIVAMQQIIFNVKPDLIIETGIAHGGSLIFYASMLELNAICGGPTKHQVLGIDVDIRNHNRLAIESHPLYKRGNITLLEGSSIDSLTINKVYDIAKNYNSVMVLLDSNHTHDHVYSELQAYAHLTSIGSYCVVFDTIVEFMPSDAYPDRPWSKGNNPFTAVKTFLSESDNFIADKGLDNSLLISVAPNGYLRKVK